MNRLGTSRLRGVLGAAVIAIVALSLVSTAASQSAVQGHWWQPWSPLATPHAPLPPLALIATPEIVPQAYLPLAQRDYHTPHWLYYGTKAACGRDTTDEGDLGLAAWHNWGPGPDDMPDNYARSFWCVSDDYMGSYLSLAAAAATADFNTGVRGRVWLVLNEPDCDWNEDNCGTMTIDGDKVCGKPRKAAARYHTVYQTIKGADPYAKMFVGGVLAVGNISGTGCKRGRWWWAEFVDKMDDEGWLAEIEGVHIHGYPGATSSCSDIWPEGDNWCMSDFEEDVEYWYSHYHANQGGGIGVDLSDRPIWITEAGCVKFNAGLHDYAAEHGEEAAWSLCRDRVMDPIVDWFDGQDEYEVLFWFITSEDGDNQWRPQFLIVNAAELTPLGAYWSSWEP